MSDDARCGTTSGFEGWTCTRTHGHDGPCALVPVRAWEHQGHRPVQHRDRKPPWCNACGWTSPVPAVPAVQIRPARARGGRPRG
jgi:hypothetical protein